MKLKIILGALLVLIANIISGCATTHIWSVSGSEDYVSETYKVDASEIYINKSKNLLCIKFDDSKNNDVDRYLLIEPKGKFNFDYLKEIFEGPSQLKVLSVNADAQTYILENHTNINLLFDVTVSIPEEPIETLKGDADTCQTQAQHSPLYSKYDVNFLTILMRQQYFNKYGFSKCEFSPLYWIDNNCNIIYEKISSNEAAQKNYRLFLKVNNLDNHSSHFLISKFDVRKYDIFNTRGIYVQEDHRNKKATMHFNNENWMWVMRKYNLLFSIADSFNPSDEWELVIQNNTIPCKLTFSKHSRENTYPLPMPLRIIATPFTVITDIVTLPLQILFITNLKI